jgi:DNA polymerase III epsilon subunit-like protein
MMQLPNGVPMWTNDVQQVAASLSLDNSLPAQTGTAHNALDDARWTRKAWEYLTAAAPGGPGRGETDEQAGDARG